MINYIEVRDPNREIIGIVDNYTSIIWQVDYYGTGSFEVYAPATKENLSYFKRNNYITRPDDEYVGIIENLNITYSSDEGKMIVATGRFAVSLLERRIIYNFASNTDGKISILPTVSSGNVEVAVRELVSRQIINSIYPARNVSFIKLGAEAGITKTIVSETGLPSKKQTSFGNLLEYTHEILQEYELSCNLGIDRESKDFVYTIFEGKDRSRNNTQGNAPVIFSQDYDNLLTSEYGCSISKANMALIGGAGEGVERFCTIIGDAATGLDRKEIWVDASSQSITYRNEENVEVKYTDAEYIDVLQNAGRQQVALLGFTESYDGEVNVHNPQYKYKQDYNVGDLVSIEDLEIGISMVVRILSVIESQDENGYMITISYGI